MLETILAIILAAENSPDGAISVSGARGAFQITEIALKDVNTEYKLNYKIEDMHDFKKGKDVATKLLMLLQKRYPEHKADVCWLVRAYNCGAKAADNHCSYWYYNRGLEKIREKA